MLLRSQNDVEDVEYLEMNIDGATIPVATVWDALALYYTINIGDPPMGTSLETWLLQHLNQLAGWISILAENEGAMPSVINVAWKSEHQKIIKISFGATLIGDRNTRKELIAIRQRIDLVNYHIFPWNTDGELERSQERHWQFGNCAETSTWFQLALQRPE